MQILTHVLVSGMDSLCCQHKEQNREIHSLVLDTTSELCIFQHQIQLQNLFADHCIGFVQSLKTGVPQVQRIIKIVRMEFALQEIIHFYITYEPISR